MPKSSRKITEPRSGPVCGGSNRFELIVADLSRMAPSFFDIRMNSGERGQLAFETGANSISKLRFAGTFGLAGTNDWLLVAMLGATVTQTCVVSLELVKTRIDAQVVRRYTPNFGNGAAAAIAPMPEDENLEPLLEAIDLKSVISEALVLELPLYPKVRDTNAKSRGDYSIGDFEEELMPEWPFAALSEFRKQLDE